MSEIDSEQASTLVSAGNQIRATAKWLVVSLAGIGGVLVAGVQLSNVGSLDADSDRLATAIWAGILVAIGAGIILGAAVITATVKAHPLSALDPIDEHFKDKTLLQGQTSLGALRKNYQEALELKRNALEANFNSPTAHTKLIATAAQARVDYLDGIVRNVLEVGAYHRLLKHWRILSAFIALGAVLAGTGVVMFAWASNPPENAKASSMTPGVVSTAAQGTVLLVDAGRKALYKQLGDKCPLEKPLSIYLLAETDFGSDIIITEEDCNPIRLILKTEWGTVQTS